MTDIEFDDANFVAARSKELLDVSAARRPTVVAELLRKGAVGSLSPFTINSSALLLGQYEFIVRNDVQAARQWFSVPLTVEPGFAQCVRYMEEALRGERPWDGVRLSLEVQLEPVLCFILLNRIEDLASEYAAADRGVSLFQDNDAIFLRPVLTRHLIMAAQQRYELITEADYARCRNLNKSSLFRDDRFLLLAIANHDADVFNSELRNRHTAFLKRKSSRLIEHNWGYGKASKWCFDVLGTVMCRLAHRRGMNVQSPDQRLYPTEFWME